MQANRAAISIEFRLGEPGDEAIRVIDKGDGMRDADLDRTVDGRNTIDIDIDSVYGSAGI